jgi:hypothetical protein
MDTMLLAPPPMRIEYRRTVTFVEVATASDHCGEFPK